MSDTDDAPARFRALSGTENSWCKAVPGGTGITVLALLTKKQPDFSLLESALHKLQASHPMLNSKLNFDAATSTFSLLISPSPSLHLQHFDLQSTAQIIKDEEQDQLTPFQALLEHELNRNSWEDSSSDDVDVFHASVYALEGEKWAMMMRNHTGACDRTAAVAVLRSLLRLMTIGGPPEEEVEEEAKMAIEEYIPSEKKNKPFWSRGVDMLGYSLNSFRLSNLDFVGPSLPRCSRVVRLMMESDHTTKLLEGCRSRGLKLCGALSAAGLMAARLSKGIPDGQWEKYAVVTLTDCRKLLEPPLSSHHVGFYHSAILNTHDMKGGEELWELAGRTYTSFRDAMNSNKHFSDMADLNFLMCRAIENPGLTPSSALRTSLISVFEDPVIDESDEKCDELGIEDYVGCASVHGVGPSIAIFDTVRDGKLDCACVYPSPLHSREQMQELIDNMKKILIDCSE